MTSDQYDVIIIGGGINGVGVAQASAAAGYKTLLLEKNAQPGLETSSNSSKLIHGGLRYLETSQFGLVRESLQERSLLLKLAPDLVRMQYFVIPVYRQSRRQTLKLHLGLTVYALLGGKSYQTLSTEHWENPDRINTRQLIKLFKYQDAQTDDQALTRSVLKSASELGAEYRFNSEVKYIHLYQNQASVEFEQDGQIKSAHSLAVVNAGGPWIEAINQRVTPGIHLPSPELVQGTHLVINQPLSQAYYLESTTDERVIFVLPWQGKTLLGTTEQSITSNPDSISPSDHEREYLKRIYQHYFPGRPFDVQSEFCGVRVLPANNGRAFSRSRETQLIRHPDYPHYLCILGGKLTVYRRTALQVMQSLAPVLPEKNPVADTATLPLKVAESL